MMALTLAARELKGLFLSPLAWTLLAVLQFVLALVFLNRLEEYLGVQAQLAQMEAGGGITEHVVKFTYSLLPTLLVLVVPLLTMRLISEEVRSRTISLLFSAPLSMTEIVLGKFLGVAAFLLLLIALLALMPLALLFGGSLDGGQFAAIVLGQVLLALAFAALGLFMSTLTQHPTVAAIGTLGALLLVLILGWAGSQAPGGSALFDYLSVQRHYQSLLQGAFDSADVAYFLLFIATFLVLSVRRLDAMRLPT